MKKFKEILNENLKIDEKANNSQKKILKILAESYYDALSDPSFSENLFSNMEMKLVKEMGEEEYAELTEKVWDVIYEGGEKVKKNILKIK